MEPIIIHFTLNGKPTTAAVDAGMTLLTALKEVLFVNSVKRACMSGECGACTVVVDGQAMNACLILAATVEGKTVETLESLGTPENMHPLQKVFVDMGASQCGFCTPGFIMSAKALLDKNPDPTEEEIRRGLSGNLCRCTGYVKPVKALQEYINNMQPGEDSVQAVRQAADALNEAGKGAV